MMGISFRKSLLVAFSLLAVELLQAQVDFRPGYIIRLNGDTVHGEIDNRSDLLMGQSCYFRAAGQPGMINLFPEEIQGYRMTKGKYFVSRDIDGKKVFLEFLIRGRISMYFLRDTRGEHYFLEKDDSGLIELPYENKVIYKNNIPQAYQSKQHIGILNTYMNDAPAMEAKIAGIRKPDRENLVRLARDYHFKMTSNKDYTIYAGNYR